MHQFLESAGIALSAIWTNKLRSLLTVLGNVVAVTSIIAVVSLVQGLNASGQGRIQSAIGVDTFTVTRAGFTRTDDDQLRAQSNPRVSLDDAAAIRRSSPSVALVMAQANAAAQLKYRGDTQDSVSIQGVSKEYVSLPTTNVEVGRVPTAAEFDAGRHVTVLGYDVADKLFGTLDPVGKDVTINGIRFEVLGVAPKKGSIFGNSQDEFAVIPLDAFQRIFGTRQSLQLTVRPRDPSLVQTAMDETTRGAARRAPPAAEAARQLRPAFVGHAPQHLQHRDGRHLCGVDWRREPLARRRRHRHHEHHADGRHANGRARSACASRSAHAGATSSGRF